MRSKEFRAVLMVGSFLLIGCLIYYGVKENRKHRRGANNSFNCNHPAHSHCVCSLKFLGPDRGLECGAIRMEDGTVHQYVFYAPKGMPEKEKCDLEKASRRQHWNPQDTTRKIRRIGRLSIPGNIRFSILQAF
jgi:hypothetical protein